MLINLISIPSIQQNQLGFEEERVLIYVGEGGLEVRHHSFNFLA